MLGSIKQKVVKPMVQVRVEHKLAFLVTGRKTWIGGDAPDNEPFGQFWTECGENGTLGELNKATGGIPGAVTGSVILGVSRIEDPTIRNFFYYIGVEGASVEGYESFLVPEGEWAIFANQGVMPDALVEAEMLAFQQWLPQTGRRHRAAPELEVYLPGGEPGNVPVEFWLPLEGIAEGTGAQMHTHDGADGGDADGQPGKALQ